MNSHRMNTKGGGSAGFTLVEIMIVLAIVGIVAAIAYPAYTDYVRRANRVDATEALLRIEDRQTKFYLQNNTYTADLTALGFNNAESTSGHYTLAIANADTNTFTATAVPLSASQNADDECQSFTVNSLGVHTSTDDGGADSTEECWE